MKAETETRAKETGSFLYKRKINLLNRFFGSVDFDSNVAQLRHMPEEFLLPDVIVDAFNEISAKRDSNKIEYAVMGDIRNGEIFLGNIQRGYSYVSYPPLKDITLNIVGLRRIDMHSHTEPDFDYRKIEGTHFSSPDTANFLLCSTTDIFALISNKSDTTTGEYHALIGVKGVENLVRERGRYLKGLYYQLGSQPRILAGYLQRRLELIGGLVDFSFLPLEQVADIFEQNGCALYKGTGKNDRKRLILNRLHPEEHMEFELDKRTGLMLPSNITF